METSSVISHYESLSVITSKMREAANHGEWDRLLDLESECLEQVTTMKRLDSVTKLDEPTRQRKISLIKKILADDAVIRNRTEYWMVQLQEIMRGNHQERLLQAYYTGH